MTYAGNFIIFVSVRHFKIVCITLVCVHHPPHCQQDIPQFTEEYLVYIFYLCLYLVYIGISSLQFPVSAQNATMITPVSVAVPHNPLANREVSTDATAAVGDGQQQSNSWSKLAADLTGHEAALQHRKIRVGAKVGDCRIKSVPRQLTCFDGRLDDSTTEEELHEYLTGVGMKGVVCKRLVPKDGRVFKTAAFRVSCCLESKELFCNESNWPAGAELRDWVFYNRNRNGQSRCTNFYQLWTVCSIKSNII